MEGMRVRGILPLFFIFVFSMVFMWIGITYVSQNIKYSSAQKFFTFVVRELENSYFADDVVANCKEEAKKNGYQLEIVPYGTREHRDARVILNFSYTFPMLQKVQRYTIEGYAR